MSQTSGPELHLHRDEFTPSSTFGILRELASGKYICDTVERERDHNRASTPTRPGACIPAGRYICRRTISPTHGEVFEVTGVVGRLYIQIHAANWSTQLRGCIAPGITRIDTDAVVGSDMVTESRKALAKIMALMDGYDTFPLTITDAYPES